MKHLIKGRMAENSSFINANVILQASKYSFIYIVIQLLHKYLVSFSEQRPHLMTISSESQGCVATGVGLQYTLIGILTENVNPNSKVSS